MIRNATNHSRSLLRLWHRSLLAVLACAAVLPPLAAETRVYDARTLLVSDVFRVGARIDLELNGTVREALDSGVPLILEIQIEVLQKHSWMWPDTVAELHQRFDLRYHALSNHYLVENFSTGERSSYPILEDALRYIGTIYDLPLIDAGLLKPHERYTVRLRAALDIEALPTPVQLWSYLGSDWSLNSDWYQWPLKP